MKNVIEIKNLTKEYKKIKAIDDLSFNVEQGEILGLLGPNGSGKSTTMNCILSLLNFSKGSIKIFGKEMNPNAYDIKKDIGVLLQSYCLPSKPKSNEDYSILLIDLDLIRQSRETKEYYFNIEGKRNVISDIFLYAILCVKGNDNSIPFEYIQEKIGLPFCTK